MSKVQVMQAPYNDKLLSLITTNLAVITMFDSYVVYNAILPIKLGIYALKLLNILAFLYLLKQNTRQNYLWLILILPLYWVYFNESDAAISIQLFFSAMTPLMTFVLLSNEDKNKFMIKYIKAYYYLCLVGIPIYFLINYANLPPTFSFFRGSDEGVGRFYDNYLLLYWSRAGVEQRFSSIFDEPGVVGTITPFIFLFYYNSLSKFQFFVLLVSGVLAFSLYFFLVIAIVLFFMNFRKFSTRKTIIYTLFSIVFILFSYVAMSKLAYATKSDRALALKFYHRFKWEGEWIVGIVNNRDSFISGFDLFIQEWNDPTKLYFYFGKGKDTVLKMFGGTLSVRVLMIDKGVLIIGYLTMLFIAVLPWRRSFVFSSVALIIMALSFYQRPGLMGINYFALIWVGGKLYEYRMKNKILI